MYKLDFIAVTLNFIATSCTVGGVAHIKPALNTVRQTRSHLQGYSHACKYTQLLFLFRMSPVAAIKQTKYGNYVELK